MTAFAGVRERAPGLTFGAGGGVGGTLVSRGGPPTVGRKPCGVANSLGRRWSYSERTARSRSRRVARGTGSGAGMFGASGSGGSGLASRTFFASIGTCAALRCNASVPAPPAATIGAV